MMIVCMSDTHNRHEEVDVPPGDVLIHAGDATNSGTWKEMRDFFVWFHSLPHKHKLFVPGNHDRIMEDHVYAWQEQFPGVEILIDRPLVIDGVVFYGSPWQPDFCNWAFNLPRGESLARKWAVIPDNTKVLITHGPPHGVGDVPMGYDVHVGCEELRKRTDQLKLALHVFGHIHDGFGIKHSHSGITVNASICDERYQATRDPVNINLRLKSELKEL